MSHSPHRHCLARLLLSPACACLALAGLGPPAWTPPAAAADTGLANPFFAMDTGIRDAAHATPADQARMLAELGYAGCDHSGTDSLAETLTTLDAKGLRLFAVYTGLTLDGTPAPTLPAPLLAALPTLKGRDAVLWVPLNSQRFGPSDPAGDAVAVPLLRALAAEADRAGLRIALYPHTGCWLERVDDGVRLARQVDRRNLGVTFNLCHWLRVDPERDLLATLTTALPHLFVVTLNGADADGRDWPTLIQTLDRGTWDNARLLATLRRLGYTGPIGLQGYGIGGDVHDNLGRSLQAWRELVRRVDSGEAQPLTGDEPFAEALAYRLGESRRAFTQIEVRCRRASRRERDRLEDRLAGLLRHPEATPDCRREACRLLRDYGTHRAVTALVERLADPDPQVGLLARAALHGKSYPEVDRALLEALATGPDAARIGILQTLADRGNRRAVGPVARLVQSPVPGVGEAAVHTLGRIGGDDAVRALRQATVPDALRPAWTDAMLACADALRREGDEDGAGDLYMDLRGTPASTAQRIAVLRGIVHSQGARALPELLVHLRGDDRDLRRAAAALAADVPGRKATPELAACLPGLPAADRVVLLAALAARGDPTAAPAVAALAADAAAEEAVRLAALDAWQTLETAGDIPALARLAATEGPVSQAAARNLARLPGAGADRALLDALLAAAPELRPPLVRAVAERRSPGAALALLPLATDAHAATRQQALAALAEVARAADLAALVPLPGQVPVDDLPLAEKAVLVAARSHADSAARRQILLPALAAASGPARASLLRVVGTFGGDAELAAVTAALQDADDGVRLAATRALAEWPDAGPTETLQRLAREAPVPAQRVLALRGCIRMLALARQADAADRQLAVCRTALEEARRPEEKRLLLQAIADAADLRLLDVVSPLLADEAVRAEAQAAVVAVLGRAATRDQAAALRLIGARLAAAPDPAFRQRLEELRTSLLPLAGFVTAWQAAGPYTATGGESLLDAVFAPEPGGKGPVEWREIDALAGPFTTFIRPGAVNLGALIGGGNRVAYLRATVIAPAAGEVVLQLGSDDGIKAWLNGQVVHANPAARAHQAGSDTVHTTLRAGANPLLLKVTQLSGEWGASARFTSPDGKPMADLTAEPR